MLLFGLSFWLMAHGDSTDHFSQSLHHSRVNVQLTAQFSAYFQREFAETGFGQYVNVARFFVIGNYVYFKITSFESTLVPPCLNSGVLIRMSQSTTKIVLVVLERITFVHLHHQSILRRLLPIVQLHFLAALQVGTLFGSR